jgi:hypothetical protein
MISPAADCVGAGILRDNFGRLFIEIHHHGSCFQFQVNSQLKHLRAGIGPCLDFVGLQNKFGRVKG